MNKDNSYMLDGGSLVLGRKKLMEKTIKKERLNNIVSENIRKVLNEELGISKEVHIEAQRIYTFLTNLLENKSLYAEYKEHSITYNAVKWVNEVTLFGGFRVTFDISLVFVRSEEEYNDYSRYMTLEFWGYNSRTNELFIHMPVFIEPDYDFINQPVKFTKSQDAEFCETIEHELKHIYQIFRTNQNNNKAHIMPHKTRKVYEKVSMWLRTYGVDGSDISKMLWAVYYLNPVEITANIQLVYGTIKRNAKTKEEALAILNSSDFVSELDFNIETLSKIITKRISIYDEYRFKGITGRDLDWLMRYAKKGVSKMGQSIRKIEKLINKEFSE
jgi:hypothetical protein